MKKLLSKLSFVFVMISVFLFLQTIYLFAAEDEHKSEILFENSSYSLSPGNGVSLHYRRKVRISSDLAIDDFADPRFIYDSTKDTITPNRVVTINPNGKELNAPATAINRLTPRSLAKAVDFTNFQELICSFIGIQTNSVCDLDLVKNSKPDEFSSGIQIEKLISSSYLIKNMAVEVELPKNLTLNYKCANSNIKPEIKSMQNNNLYSWVFKDIAPVKHEYAAPNKRNYLPYLIISSLHDWDAALKPLRDTFFVKQAIPKEIKTKVVEITKNKIAPVTKIMAIYDYITTTFSTIHIDEALLHYKSRTLSRIYHSNYGSELEQLLLLKTMLEIEGVKTALIFVGPLESTFPSVPTLKQFQRIALEVNVNNFTSYLSTEMSPEEWNVENLRAQRILRVTGTKYSFIEIPSELKNDSLLDYELNCKVKKDFSFSGKLFVHYQGCFSPYYSLKKNIADAIQNNLSNLGSDIKVKNVLLQLFSPAEVSFTLDISGKLNKEEYSKNTFFITLPRFSDAENLMPKNLFQKSRIYPVELKTAFDEKATITLKLPKDCSIIFSNPAISLQNNVGYFHQSFKKEKQSLTFKRNVTINKRIIPSDNYKALLKISNEYTNKKNHGFLIKITI